MRLPVALLVLGVTLACQRSENRYATRKVTPMEVHGTWTMTPTGIEGLRYAGHTKHLNEADHVLVIRPDGSCSLRGFVDALKTSGADEGFVATDCQWSLGEIGHQALMIRIQGQRADTLGPYFHFDEENGKLLLWQYAGDPDAWKYVEFAKQSDQARASS